MNLKHIQSFQLFETLGSYDIDIVEKKLDSFFKSHGFNKKVHGQYNTDIEEPNYSIFSDRVAIRKYTTDIDKMNSYLNEFKKGDVWIQTQPSDKIDDKFISDLLHIIDSCGYFVSVAGKYKNESSDKSKIKEHLLKFKDGGIQLGIEPNYDKEIKYDGEYVYHATEKKYLDSIMKNGLIPKSKNTRSFYPGRVYLSPDIESMDYIKGELEKDKSGDYVYLQINNTPNLKFYRDVRFKSGFYTYNNIHPKNIKVIEK